MTLLRQTLKEVALNKSYSGYPIELNPQDEDRKLKRNTRSVWLVPHGLLSKTNSNRRSVIVATG